MYQIFLKGIVYTFLLGCTVSVESRVSIVRSRKQAEGLKFYILDFIGAVKEHGYEAEWHNVTTEDGYILALFRLLPNDRLYNKSKSRPVVYLQHGLTGTGDMFILLGPQRGLAYILSDAGYDVWVGNLRGCVYSQKHRTLSPSDSQFWNFSMDEYALKDLPALIDYTLKTTGRSSLSYAGVSLGTTMNIILLSNRTEYNDKLNLVVHFAPVTFWKTRNFAVNVLSTLAQLLEPLVAQGAFNIAPHSEVIYLLMKLFCISNDTRRKLCFSLFDLFAGWNREQFNLTDAQILQAFLHYPAGVSAKACFHYLQHIKTGTFRFYDHGNDEINFRYYGQKVPLDYNVSNITAPMVIFHGTKDPLSTAESDRIFLSELPRTTTVIYESVKGFGHADFVIAKNVKELVYDKILALLPKFNP